MALEPINVGIIVNDGTGDDLRTAFIKINQNFEEIELQGGQANTISNIGSGIGLYKEKIGVDLRLKSLVAGTGISLSGNPTDITITNTSNMIITINADTGSLTASSPTDAINIVGGGSITTNITGNTLTITGGGRLVDDPDPQLSATLFANNNDIVGVNLLQAQNLEASNLAVSSLVAANAEILNISAIDVQSLIYGIDIRELQNQLLTFDFGVISNDWESPIQFLLATTSLLDMGTIVNPSTTGIDGGSL